MNKNFNRVVRITTAAMLTALSIVSLYIIHLPILPSAPFLEYDCADIPVLIGTLVLGPVFGEIILLAVCLIQAFTVSAASGIIGFLMHFFASTLLILIPGIIYAKKKTVKALITGLILGIIGMTVIMIPLNLVFTGIFLGAGTKTVISMLMPAIIPFNLLKGTINAVVTILIYLPIKDRVFKQG